MTAPTTAGVRRPPFLANLDALRGLAALMVVLCHSPWMTPLTTFPPVRVGWVFVDLFFVLSGFVIALNYAGRLAGMKEGAVFMLRRAFRLYPLHLVTLGVCVLQDAVRNLIGPALHLMRARDAMGGAYWGQVLASALLVSGLGVVADPGPNGPSWSISTEVFAYLVFAAVGLLVPRRRIALVFLAIAVFAYAVLQALQPGAGLDGPLQFRAFRCLFAFGLGVGAWGLYDRISDRVGVRASLLGQLLAWAAALLVIWQAPHDGRLSPLLPPLFAAAILAGACDPGSWLKRVLEVAPLQRLGELSYSIYLTHVAVENALSLVFNRFSSGLVTHDGVARLQLPPLDAAIAMILYVGGTLAVSSLTYRLIEAPARALGRRWTARLARSEPALGRVARLAARP